MPVLYGEKPGIVPPGSEILKAGVSEVLDHGKEVVVLFSVVNLQEHAVELMPPQVQLGGKVKRGKIVHHTVSCPHRNNCRWKISDEPPPIGPGERADGVLIFRRPSFKQSTETLLLQMAEPDAVDRLALAPVGSGSAAFEKKEANRWHRINFIGRTQDGMTANRTRQGASTVEQRNPSKQPAGHPGDSARSGRHMSERETWEAAVSGKAAPDSKERGPEQGVAGPGRRVVIMIFGFLAMFSSSKTTTEHRR